MRGDGDDPGNSRTRSDAWGRLRAPLRCAPLFCAQAERSSVPPRPPPARAGWHRVRGAEAPRSARGPARPASRGGREVAPRRCQAPLLRRGGGWPGGGCGKAPLFGGVPGGVPAATAEDAARRGAAPRERRIRGSHSGAAQGAPTRGCGTPVCSSQDARLFPGSLSPFPFCLSSPSLIGQHSERMAAGAPGAETSSQQRRKTRAQCCAEERSAGDSAVGEGFS